MSASVSAELEALAGQAQAIDAAEAVALDPAAPAGSPEVAPPDPAAEVAALLATVAALLSPMFPSLGTIYTESTCRRLGDAAAPVLAKYDLSVGGLFERWGPEITLLGAALPVGVATWKGVKADLAARRAPKDEPAPTDGQQ